MRERGWGPEVCKNRPNVFILVAFFVRILVVGGRVCGKYRKMLKNLQNRLLFARKKSGDSHVGFGANPPKSCLMSVFVCQASHLTSDL